ncbi:MAG TPA: UDP-3-O-(3-hydroxymyristoyl)glucosamine N-acyltransferase, partial [Pyrinomonadaceae bacterium]
MRIEEIAEFLDGQLIGDGNGEIFAVASVENAGSGEISFVEKIEKIENISETLNLSAIKASCLLIPENFDTPFPFPIIKVKNPKLAFAKIAAVLHPPKKRVAEIHRSAVVAENARVGRDVFIGAFVCVGENSQIGTGTQIREGAKIGDNVKIGSRCTIHPNVFIEGGCTIGDNVVLHCGVVIGADGFGYVRADARGYVKFPQIGTVVIEDDAEIGANTCIDRGALGETRVGKGTKIDNLVQIAHNVRVGERVVIAAQTGISGSTVIEDDCVIGGQVGMGDHARVLSGAI